MEVCPGTYCFQCGLHFCWWLSFGFLSHENSSFVPFESSKDWRPQAVPQTVLRRREIHSLPKCSENWPYTGSTSGFWQSCLSVSWWFLHLRLQQNVLSKRHQEDCTCEFLFASIARSATFCGESFYGNHLFFVSCRSHVGSVYRMRSHAVSRFSNIRTRVPHDSH